MIRYPDWPSRLMGAIDAARAKPFSWGELDCCLFACDCVAAMTGVDPAAWFRGRYHTAAGARRKLRIYSGGGLEATVALLAARHGLPEIMVAQAQRGDLVLIDAAECPPEARALAVCAGLRLAVMTERGVGFVSPARGLRAWRV
jgi:hypothetical protein